MAVIFEVKYPDSEPTSLLFLLNAACNSGEATNNNLNP
jgi:hypothetical protein